MLDVLPNTVTLGARTYGASGNPQPHELGNGVTVFLTSWRDMPLDGTPIEGHGIEPRIAVDATIAELSVRDPVIDRAIEETRKLRR
jgi:C-terminal processing protease CtpA/Prc